MSRFTEVIVLAKEAEQVLIRDEEDDCFGLWMLYDGKLAEVPLPRTDRYNNGRTITGVLSRTDRT